MKSIRTIRTAMFSGTLAIGAVGVMGLSLGCEEQSPPAQPPAQNQPGEQQPMVPPSQEQTEDQNQGQQEDTGQEQDAQDTEQAPLPTLPD